MQVIGTRGLRGAVRAGAAVVAVGLLAAGARPAAAQSYAGVFSGTQQVPPNASTATGLAGLTLAGNLLTVDVTWSGLTGGPLQMAHLHCCAPPGANAPVAIPFVGIATTTVGRYSNTFDLSNASVYESAFLVANGGTAASAAAAFITGLNGGLVYANIHTVTYPAGEIRANIATVPEPTSVALAALGLGGVGLVARRRRQQA